MWTIFKMVYSRAQNNDNKIITKCKKKMHDFSIQNIIGAIR